MILRYLTISILIVILFDLNTNLGAQSQQVLTGIDVLEREEFVQLFGKRVGLITNQTGMNRFWRPTIDILFNAKNVNLVALFSPEHGIRGTAEGKIPSNIDSITGLNIYSLYGETRQPTDRMLNGIETFVFDIQDIGTRFYTYIGTMKLCMQEAAKNNIEFIVLDRPNPINGVDFEGPILSPEQVFGLVGSFPIPIRHGMTVGELALMYNGEEKLGLNLKIIKIKNWKRELWFDQTGLPWINPSPNMRNLYEATLYPGIGLLERTNVEDKRGLERPFEMFGAPWINSIELAIELNRQNISGVRFVPIKFIPEKSRYKNQLCEGVAISLLDRNSFQPVKCGIIVLQVLYKLYADKFDVKKVWHVTRSDLLIEQVKNQVPIEDIVNSWKPGLENFSTMRNKYLLY
ncbi:MAG: DUF1343 domain-containing protein [Calditrichia bacterium]|nr:DUF1343 domain-containing protein [Calditrichia bacterium]